MLEVKSHVFAAWTKHELGPKPSGNVKIWIVLTNK